MSASVYVPLPHRALFRLGGNDPRTFLQGLVSADVMKASAQHAVYGAFLTPQGRFLHEFFLAAAADALLLETDAERRDDFMQRLGRYNLRRTVTLSRFDDWRPYALFGDAAAVAGSIARGGTDGIVFADPRLPAAGWRAWLPDSVALEAAGARAVDFAEWDRLRVHLGLPDGARDLVPDKTILLEAGFDELGGVDWQKGCFLGQEVTARSKYRGHVRRRLMPVVIDGPAPAPGTAIYGADTEVGDMASSVGTLGLAYLRLDTVAAATELRADAARLTPHTPDWFRL